MSRHTLNHCIHARLEEFRKQERVQATSLIITVFGDAILPRGGRVWLGSLAQLLAPLGISDRLVRTSVFRLVKDEWLTTEAHGRRTDYMLSHLGRRRFDEAARHIYALHSPPWDRRWRLLLPLGEWDAREREALGKSLRWQGFGELPEGGFLHPTADLTAATEGLLADGHRTLLGRIAPLLAVNLQGLYGARDSDMVRGAWNLDELAHAYQDFIQQYQPILDAMVRGGTAAVEPVDAFALRTLLIHDFRRLLLRDPELPDELLPPGWEGTAARHLCAQIYRRLGPASEQLLQETVQLADGTVPALVAQPRFIPEAGQAAQLLNLP